MALIPRIALAIDVSNLYAEPYVYFVYKDEELLYIGRSAQLATRLQAHKHSGKDFNKVLALPCPEEMPSAVEAVFIYKHAPKLNRRIKRPTAEEFRSYRDFMRGSTPSVTNTSQVG